MRIARIDYHNRHFLLCFFQKSDIVVLHIAVGVPLYFCGACDLKRISEYSVVISVVVLYIRSLLFQVNSGSPFFTLQTRLFNVDRGLYRM